MRQNNQNSPAPNTNASSALSEDLALPISVVASLKLETPALIRQQYSRLIQIHPAKSPAEIRQEITGITGAAFCAPSDLMSCLSQIPVIQLLYAQDARIMEAYTISEHSSMYLGQAEHYLAHPAFDCPLSLADRRLLGALHDIGKSLPDSVKEQHVSTILVIDAIREYLPWDERQSAFIKATIAFNPIGPFIVSNVAKFASIEERKSIAQLAANRVIGYQELSSFASLVEPKDITPEMVEAGKQVARKIKAQAEAFGFSPLAIYNLQILLYIADTAAYTHDAVATNGRRASPGLEFLYELNPSFIANGQQRLLVADTSSGLVKFAPKIAAMLNLLRPD